MFFLQNGSPQYQLPPLRTRRRRNYVRCWCNCPATATATVLDTEAYSTALRPTTAPGETFVSRRFSLQAEWLRQEIPYRQFDDRS